MHRRLVQAAGAFLLLTGLAVPAAVTGAHARLRPQAATSASTITIGLGNVPTNADPYAFLAPPETYMDNALFDALTRYNAQEHLEPGLAVSWKNISPTQWVFTLRQGVKFQDGEPFNAQTVRFVVNYVLNPKDTLASAAAGRINTIKSVTVLGPYRVEITTAQPDPILPARMATLFMVPPKYFAKVGEQAFALKPVGTGPYELTKLVPQNEVVLTAWPQSWRGAPRTQTIIFKQITNPATRLAALQSGQIDIAQAVPPDLIPTLKSQGIQVVAGLRAQVQTVELDTLAPGPLQNVLVRRALNYAVNVAAITQKILGGTTTPASQLVGPDGFGYDPNLKPYGYNPTLAKKLLAEAGYPHGFSITAQATVGNFPNDQLSYEAVAGYLRKVGVNVKLQFIPFPQWLKEFFGGGRAPLWFEGLEYLPVMDASFAYQWYSCSEPTAMRTFCDPKFDALMAKANSTMNRARRLKLLQEAAVLFHNEAPDIFLYQLSDVWGVRGNVHGMVARADAVIPLWDLYKS